MVACAGEAWTEGGCVSIPWRMRPANPVQAIGSKCIPTRTASRGCFVNKVPALRAHQRRDAASPNKLIACGTQAWSCVRQELVCAFFTPFAHGAAGAVKRPSVPHALSGAREGNRRPAAPGRTRNGADDVCLRVSEAMPFNKHRSRPCEGRDPYAVSLVRRAALIAFQATTTAINHQHRGYGSLPSSL
jgi:hypothetical protein